MKITKARQEEASKFLISMLGPTPKVYGQVTKISASGMFRRVQILTIVDPVHPRICDVTKSVAHALGCDSNEWGIPVPGSGFCAVDHTVSNLSYQLYSQASVIAYERL